MWYLNNDVEPFEKRLCLLSVKDTEYGKGNCFCESYQRCRLLKENEKMAKINAVV